MGADIHSFAEVKKDGKWTRVKEPVFDSGKTTEPFGNRSYAVFGFLADVRNYSHCTPLAEPKGLPHDSEYLNQPSEYGKYERDMYGEAISEAERGTGKAELLYLHQSDYHSFSWFTLKELLDFNYEQTFWNRRITRTTKLPSGALFSDGAALAEEGEGETITYREHLGESYFADIETLKSLGEPEDVRVIFWFDN